MDRYLIELLTPKQASPDFEADLGVFKQRFEAIQAAGATVSIPDNPLGHLHFTALEVLSYLELNLNPASLLIHLNTCHRKADLDDLLQQAADRGLRTLLCVTGDGGSRLPRLMPSDLGVAVETVTSIELLQYIGGRYPDQFTLGVAFNPYEPPDHEMAKLKRKVAAGARFVITQPLFEAHPQVRTLAEFGGPVWIGAWMSRRIQLFYECIGTTPPPDVTAYDPVKTFHQLEALYPRYGFYLSLMRFKPGWMDLLPRPGRGHRQRQDEVLNVEC